MRTFPVVFDASACQTHGIMGSGVSGIGAASPRRKISLQYHAHPQTNPSLWGETVGGEKSQFCLALWLNERFVRVCLCVLITPVEGARGSKSIIMTVINEGRFSACVRPLRKILTPIGSSQVLNHQILSQRLVNSTGTSASSYTL